VALRRFMLEKMGLLSDVRVLDVCSGYGLIWTEMEKHCTIKRWVRCDIAPRPDQTQSSMLRMSAIQSIGSMPLHEFNVIDIDTYGEPMEALFVLLRRFTTPLVVFMTHGRTLRGADTSNFAKSIVGLPTDWPIPQLPHVVDYIAERCLEAIWEYATIIDAAKVESPPGQAKMPVTYYALALEPLGYLDPNGPARAITLE
jgi:hypothetical protein